MATNWVVEDGSMKVFTAEGKNPGQPSGGDILYATKKFRNFELSVDWKASKMANSGIFLMLEKSPDNQFTMRHQRFRFSIMLMRPIIKLQVTWQVHFMT